MTNPNCQVCGGPMYSQAYMGLDAMGASNAEYCSQCYRDGQAYSSHFELNFFGPSIPWTSPHDGRGY